MVPGMANNQGPNPGDLHRVLYVMHVRDLIEASGRRSDFTKSKTKCSRTRGGGALSGHKSVL